MGDIMKRMLVLFTAILFILFLPGCVSTTPGKILLLDSIKTYRDIPGITDEEISAVEAIKADKNKFSYGACLATEAFILSDGSYAGFTKIFCGILSDLFDIEFVLELYDWDELLNNLESGTLDFTGELTPTEERMQIYGMTSPIAERSLRIFTNADSNGIKTEADAEGLNIGFLTGSVTADSIKKSYNVNFKVIDVDNYQMAAAMIKNGEIDAFVEEAVADPAFEEFNFIHSQVFFSLVHAPVSMTTANLDLLPVISVVNKYIAAGGIEKLYELYKEGDFDYAKYKLGKSFTDEEQAYINDLKLRGASVGVAFEHDNYPIDFYNEKESEFEGIAVDVLSEISRLTDIEFKPAVAKDTIWAQIYEKLTAGEIQMVAQLLYSEERKDQFIWSDTPYAHSYYALMSRADYPHLATYQISQAVVGVMKQSGKANIYRKLFPENNNLKEYDTQYDCLDALELGEIDLLMASEYMLLTQTNYREKSGLKINIKLNEPLNSHFGFHKNETVLCSIINKAQRYVQTDIIEISWTGRSFDYSQKLAEERMLYLTVFLAVMFVVLAATVFVLVKNIKLSKKLKAMAHTDVLTDIYNRRFFMELAALQMARSIRAGIDCFVIIFDLDHFKAVNDTYGHLAGDKVLKDVAGRVKKIIRLYDILGRYGGEEFIMLMTDVKEIDKTTIINATERIRQEICKTPVEFEGREIPVSASFGIACVDSKNDLTIAIKYADEALYRAKEEGRNRVVFY